MCVCMCVSERERERQTDRRTETETETQRDIEMDNVVQMNVIINEFTIYLGLKLNEC